jgi:hypothetical protein
MVTKSICHQRVCLFRASCWRDYCIPTLQDGGTAISVLEIKWAFCCLVGNVDNMLALKVPGKGPSRACMSKRRNFDSPCIWGNKQDQDPEWGRMKFAGLVVMEPFNQPQAHFDHSHTCKEIRQCERARYMCSWGVVRVLMWWDSVSTHPKLTHFYHSPFRTMATYYSPHLTLLNWPQNHPCSLCGCQDTHCPYCCRDATTPTMQFTAHSISGMSSLPWDKWIGANTWGIHRYNHCTSPFSDFTHCRPGTRLDNCPYHTGHPDRPVNGYTLIGWRVSILHVTWASQWPIKTSKHCLT